MTRPLARIVIAIMVAATAMAAQVTDRVVRIIDGDTVVLAQLGTARLIGVDTPETVDPRKPVQAFGREASAFTKGLLLGKTVRIERDQTDRDRYGRALVYLYLDDGTLANQAIIRSGFGHAYTEFPFAKMEAFRATEREARQAGVGLWSSGAPQTANATIVWIAPTGDRYHVKDCRTLKNGKSPMRLDETPGHYTPCKICHPPELK